MIKSAGKPLGMLAFLPEDWHYKSEALVRMEEIS